MKDYNCILCLYYSTFSEQIQARMEYSYFFYLTSKKESGTEIGNSLASAQLSRAVKADEISVVEPTQPLRLARQSKNN